MKTKSKKQKKQLKNKTFKRKKGGSSKCKPATIDCFHDKAISQLGTNNYQSNPNLSEIAFNIRYNVNTKQIGGNKLSDGIINVSKIVNKSPNKFKNIPIVISNGRFSTLGLKEKEANELQKILKKKFPNTKKEIYSTGGYKVYFDNNKLHKKLNSSLNLLGGGKKKKSMKGGKKSKVPMPLRFLNYYN